MRARTHPSGFLAKTVFCVLPVTTIPARSGTFLEPIASRGFGTTSFRFQSVLPVVGEDPFSGEANLIGESELIFPLDTWIVGTRVGWTHNQNRPVSAWAAAWTNVGDPSAPMTDSDWFGIKSTAGSQSSTALFKFSYTESRTRLRRIGGEAGAEVGGFALFGKPLRYGFQLQTERIAAVIYGAEGWQRLPDEAPVQVNIPSGVKALTYEVWHILPRITATLTLARIGRVRIEGGSWVAPGAFAIDKDDHLLRGKDSRTTTFGFECGGMARLLLPLGENTEIGMGVDGRWLRTWGEMRQRFYGDDPSTSDDETGLRLDGIDNVISALSGGISLGLRWHFP